MEQHIVSLKEFAMLNAISAILCGILFVAVSLWIYISVRDMKFPEPKHVTIGGPYYTRFGGWTHEPSVTLHTKCLNKWKKEKKNECLCCHKPLDT